MMENKALLELIKASQDALLGNNNVLAFKILQSVEKVIKVESVQEEKYAESDKPTNVFTALHKPRAVYAELEERVATHKKQEEPEIIVIENKILPANQRVLDKVNEKAKKLGMDLAEKVVEVPKAVEEVLTEEDKAEAEAEAEVEESVKKSDKKFTQEIIIIEEKLSPEKQAAVDKVEKIGDKKEHISEENK